ncbi:MerR family transcriptional regulator [Aeromonas hydrophila]
MASFYTTLSCISVNLPGWWAPHHSLYEQLGLLPEPRRRGSYRVYRAEDLEWVGFIREAQRLCCKLGERVPLLIKKPRIAGLFVIDSN